MNYISFKFNTPTHSNNSSKINKVNLFDRILMYILPAANPDFEDTYKLVSSWYIEFDIKKSLTTREIGLNKNGAVILIGPYNNNYGYWTDNKLDIVDYRKFHLAEISQEEFIKYWNKFKQ